MTTSTSERIRASSRGRRATRMGVLHVITSTARRGAEVFAVDLAEELAARGRHVRTVALAPGPDPNGLPVPTLGRTALGWRTLRSLRREAARYRVVVAHGSSAVVATALATVASRTPFVYRNIGDPTFWLDTGKRLRRTRWILRRARTIVALWEGSAATLRRLGGSNLDIRVIPKGVPASRFPPVDARARHEARSKLGLGSRGIVAAYVGSLSYEKNVDVAITAVASIPDADLLVVGDGPERERLAALAERLAPGRVRFLGTLERPQEALAAADVLVLPSHTEGIPGVLIEAAFSEMPVVATAVGGVPEIVLDGRSGELVAPGDAHAVAQGIRSVVPHARAKGRAGRRHCLERFEIGVVADTWDALLGDLGAWDDSDDV